MKPVAVFLSGIAAMLVGASIRSCQPDVPTELLMSWCGPAPQTALAAAHQHCAGCVVMFTGIAAMLAAPLMPLLRKRRARAK